MTRDTNVPHAIATRESTLYAAMLALDHAALEQILAEDLSYVHSTGVAASKRAIWRLLLRQAKRIPVTADHATEA
ncbi:MAG TPA: hypothetical protein VNE67_03295 [Acetobacteraceae bacterium]|nr:hypothetical protein [Acetobacteraceae bacterium]